MPSSYTASLRYTLQATGENNNTWGVILNSGVFQLVDTAIAGWLTKALTGPYTLTTANGAADEARTAMLRFTGAGAFTVTVPAVSKRYDIQNACTGVLTLSNGSVSVNVQPGETVGVITDGGGNIARIQPTDFAGASLTNVLGIAGLANPTAANQAANKSYVDAAVLAAGWTVAGMIPITPTDANKLLTNNGSVPSWTASAALTSLTVGGAPVATTNDRARRRLLYGMLCP